MRKVYLENLPTRKNGHIDWKHSIGKEVEFIYDDIKGEFAIKDYRRIKNEPEVKVKYLGVEKWTNITYLRMGYIGELIGVSRAKLNENYFEKIDNGNKAYILGFMYADGTVYKDKHSAKLDLQFEDIQILEDIKREMQIECSIKVYTDQKTWFYNENKEKVYYPKKDTARLLMSSTKIANDLSKLGCIPSKTYTLKFPKAEFLPQEFERDFIRGYFDGDGSISYSTRKGKYGDSLHFNMTFTGTYEIVSGIKYLLNKNCCDFIGDIRSRRNNGVNNYTLNIDGNDIILKICDYMYRDCSLKLDRKFEKYNLLTKEIERRNNNPLWRRSVKFKMYKDGEYVDTFESISSLVSISEKRFGVKLTHSSISDCLHNKYNKNNVYKGFTFELVA